MEHNTEEEGFHAEPELLPASTCGGVLTNNYTQEKKGGKTTNKRPSVLMFLRKRMTLNQKFLVSLDLPMSNRQDIKEARMGRDTTSTQPNGPGT